MLTPILGRTLDALRKGAANITDTRIMSIVLAFLAGALVVSLGSAGLLAIEEGAAAWEWLYWADNLLAWLDGFAQNFGTEMIGTAITFVLLEVVLHDRRERDAKAEAEQIEKERLILQMGSQDNGFAIEATWQLRARGWGFGEDASLLSVDLFDANLQGANLNKANLQGADLSNAGLQGTNLWYVNLQNSNLSSTDLRSAQLGKVNLKYADLSAANLQGANLSQASLQGANLNQASLDYADLSAANLQDANLSQASLRGANLSQANLQGTWNINLGMLREATSLEGTTLPDGTMLPGDPFDELVEDWRTPFEVWCKTVKTDWRRNIIPAPLEDEGESDTNGGD